MICTQCNKDKDVSEFYKTQSGYGKGVLSECKACQKSRSKNYKPLPPDVAGYSSEQRVMTYLQERGVMACTGKSTAGNKRVDLVVWGEIKLEVKSSIGVVRYGSECFLWQNSPKQRKTGYSADFVVLVCRHMNSTETYHFFKSDHPAFYKEDGSMKSGFDYRKGRKQINSKALLTDAIMFSAKDRIDMLTSDLFRRYPRLIEDSGISTAA